jgi:hypothetical protein
VVAERPGVYEITASVTSSEPDPDLSNNSRTFKFEVVTSSPPPQSGGSAATASAVTLAPAKAKAGRPLVASVSVRAGEAAVKPSAVRCAGSVGAQATAGKPGATAGKAICRYKPPASAKGKTLRGAISFTARGKRFTKRFSVKLG